MTESRMRLGVIETYEWFMGYHRTMCPAGMQVYYYSCTGPGISHLGGFTYQYMAAACEDKTSRWHQRYMHLRSSVYHGVAYEQAAQESLTGRRWTTEELAKTSPDVYPSGVI